MDPEEFRYLETGEKSLNTYYTSFIVLVAGSTLLVMEEDGVADEIAVEEFRSWLRNQRNLEGLKLFVSPSAIMSCVPICRGMIRFVLKSHLT